MAFLAVRAATGRPSAAGAVLSVAGGSVAVLLLLYLLAVAAELMDVGIPGLAAALDPARPGSLPALWGLALIGIAALVAGGVALRSGDVALLRLALLPLALGVVEIGDLAARLEPHAGLLVGASSGTLGAKLVAVAVSGGIVLAVAVVAAVGRTAPGRRCLVAVLLLGGAAAACELAGRIFAEPVPLSALSRAWEVAEETVELGLYAVVAATVLAAAVPLDGDEAVP